MDIFLYALPPIDHIVEAREWSCSQPSIRAGVIGLSTALKVQENGYAVTILAETLPSDPKSIRYTSQWAVCFSFTKTIPQNRSRAPPSLHVRHRALTMFPLQARSADKVRQLIPIPTPHSHVISSFMFQEMFQDMLDMPKILPSGLSFQPHNGNKLTDVELNGCINE